MSAVGFLNVSPFTARDERDNDDKLAEFYGAVFNTDVFVVRAGSAAPSRIEVDDIESTLTRVWDLGGTIVSASESADGLVTRATIRDLRGRLVTIDMARAKNGDSSR